MHIIEKIVRYSYSRSYRSKISGRKITYRQKTKYNGKTNTFQNVLKVIFNVTIRNCHDYNIVRLLSVPKIYTILIYKILLNTLVIFCREHR